MRKFTRLTIATLGALALSANPAWAQPDPPRKACSVLQAEWESAWPNSSRQRDLEENRPYGSGHRVGAPISIDGNEPTSWHSIDFKLVNQRSPKSFYLNELDGQIHTHLRQRIHGSQAFDHEHRSSYPLSVEVWLLGGPKNRQNPSNAQKYCNERRNEGCGDCRLQTITVNVSISDEPERPERPRAPRVSGVHGSLTVSWDLVDTNPDIDTYDVQYRAGGVKPFLDGPQGVSGTSATIENLDAHFNYQVRVRATNGEGDGPWSPTTAARTTEPETDDDGVPEDDDGVPEDDDGVGGDDDGGDPKPDPDPSPEP